MGYHRAGFEVVGVDIKAQKHYPFEFHQADAMTYPLDGFDAIHASPPCQHYSTLHARYPDREYPDLIARTRARLIESVTPWMIENVMTAPLLYGVMLCGGMFGLRTYRHRRFETSWLCFQPTHPRHIAKTSMRKRRACWEAGMHISVTGDVGSYVGPLAMGIEWMTGNELCQAIPPAYTEWLGRQLLAVLERQAA
jgi:DNA (cytosine-5)-methyltransferase 1